MFGLFVVVLLVFRFLLVLLLVHLFFTLWDRFLRLIREKSFYYSVFYCSCISHSIIFFRLVIVESMSNRNGRRVMFAEKRSIIILHKKGFIS